MQTIFMLIYLKFELLHELEYVLGMLIYRRLTLIMRKICNDKLSENFIDVSYNLLSGMIQCIIFLHLLF